MLNIPWRTGINMREFAYYGTRIRQTTPADLQRRQLEKLKSMNVKLVRFYAAATDLSIDECIQNVGKALDLIREFGMQAIVCLDDAVGSDFCIPGRRDMPTANGHYHKNYYVKLLYLQHYIPFVEALVGQFKDHEGVLIWEIGNEHALHPSNPAPSQADMDAFYNFVKLASKTIKDLAPKHLVSTGLLNSRQISYALPDSEIKAFARRLYSLPDIDVVGIHYYQQDDEKKHGLIDADVALNEVRKPIYIGEFGAVRTFDRPPYFQQEFAEWKDKAFSVMPWAFDVHTSDCNIGDDKSMSFQFQNNRNDDFDRLCEIVRSFGVDVEPFRPSDRPVDRGLRARVEPVIGTHKTFTVRAPLGLKVRPEPTIQVEAFEGIRLRQGQTIAVDPDSRRVDPENKFVWWHHSLGWSAEKSVDGSEVFMTPASGEAAEALRLSRNAPEGAFIPQLEDGHVTLRNIVKFIVDEGETIDVNALSLRDNMFLRLPVDSADFNWIQPFGNTPLAFGLSAAEHQGTREGYHFSQGLHGGIDLGYSQRQGALHARVVVRAGVRGTIAEPESRYNPNRVRINVAGGDYRIIYGHLSQTVSRPEHAPPPVGQEVNEDTIIGEIAPREELVANGIHFTPHLHLEVRYLDLRPNLILNPLMFMSERLRDICLGKSSQGFHPWRKWQNHFDQPVIRLQGRPDTAILIGPRTEIV